MPVARKVWQFVGRAELGLPAAPLDHPEHVDPVHPVIAEAAFFRHPAPERRAGLFLSPMPAASI